VQSTGGGFLINLIWIVSLILVSLNVGHVPDEIYDGVVLLEDCKILRGELRLSACRGI
jgi:hypothetical protein